MFLSRGVKNRASKLGVKRTREHAFEGVAVTVPKFNAVRKLVGLRCDDAQPRGLGYSLVHRGSLVERI